MSIRVFSYAASDIGRVREKNEDYWFANDKLGLYVLADGMGGHPRGDIASKLAVSSVVDFVSTERAKNVHHKIEDLAQRCILEAHARLVESNGDASEANSMGTTLSVVFVEEEHFAVSSVGDSKCFWISSVDELRRITQISRDDTIAATLIRKGVPPEMIRGRENHTLTQAIGLSGEVRPHLACGVLAPGDMIVMCSDGITDYMPPPVFRDTALSLARSPRALVEAFIRGALAGGGGDNCTCICILARV